MDTEYINKLFAEHSKKIIKKCTISRLENAIDDLDFAFCVSDIKENPKVKIFLDFLTKIISKFDDFDEFDLEFDLDNFETIQKAIKYMVDEYAKQEPGHLYIPYTTFFNVGPKLAFV